MELFENWRNFKKKKSALRFGADRKHFDNGPFRK